MMQRLISWIFPAPPSPTRQATIPVTVIIPACRDEEFLNGWLKDAVDWVFLDAPDVRGQTLLGMLCLLANDTKEFDGAIRYLLRRGFNPNVMDRHNNTPWHVTHRLDIQML